MSRVCGDLCTVAKDTSLCRVGGVWEETLSMSSLLRLKSFDLLLNVPLQESPKGRPTYRFLLIYYTQTLKSQGSPIFPCVKRTK